MRIDPETGEVIWDDFDEELLHSGTPHEGIVPHSGRFPWGSGENAFQRPRDFYSFVRRMEKKGLTEIEIAKGMNETTTEFRAYKSVAFATVEREMLDRITELQGTVNPETNKVYTNQQIADILTQEFNPVKPINESRVRNLASGKVNATENAAVKTANALMECVDRKGMIDVGTQVERELGVTKEKLDQALIIAEANGYVVLKGHVEQQGHPGQITTLRILAPAGTPKNKAYDYANIKQFRDYEGEVANIDISSSDNGKTFRKNVYPRALDPNRVAIRYKEDGGADKDGVIELRRGLPDLSLGKSNYAQARILVDNGGGDKDLYLKGMALYNNGDMPDGKDIIFNTKKPRGTPFADVLKSVKENLDKDPENPFGATIKEAGGQTYYDDPNGEFIDPATGHKQSLNYVNKTREEGEWSQWSKETPSQFLSKQPIDLIAKQLQKSINDRRDEYASIMEVDNPTVKAKLMEDFANDCDATAVELKAARLPGARYHVILPSTTLKSNECYAPNYPDGTQLALVRFPHAGPFEIPIVTVNNKNKEGKDIVGPNSNDGIMINSEVASRLSGADFDGDTVIAIPTKTNGIDVKSTRALPGLVGFDTDSYGPDANKEKVVDDKGNEFYYRNGIKYKRMSESFKQKQMGIVSNLITDMQLIGASDDEMERAVKHSMVVIDARKHKLDYKSSYKDNKIDELKKKYQPHVHNDGYGGASTLISLAKNPKEINARTLGKYILDQEGNPDNGNELVLVDKIDKVFYDPKTNKVYNEHDKKTVNYDPKTGEKLYRDTYDGYVKVKFLDDSNKELPAYVKVAGSYKRPYDVAKETMLAEHPESFKVIAKDYNLYYKDEDGSYIKVDRNDKNVQIISVRSTIDVPKMEYVKDANELSSGTLKEEYYVKYANFLKALANDARKEYMYNSANPIPYNAEARVKYKEEYDSLVNKLDIAQRNAPKERAANLMAAAIVKQWIENATCEYTNDQIQKRRDKELQKARVRYGAKRYAFEITDKEWEAIQAGAITRNRLEIILKFADPDAVRKLATPRETKQLTEGDITRIKNFAAKGETNAAIAKRLVISVSTVSRYLNEEDD